MSRRKDGMPKTTPDLRQGIKVSVEIEGQKYGAIIKQPEGRSMGVQGEVARVAFEAGQMVSRTVMTHYAHE